MFRVTIPLFIGAVMLICVYGSADDGCDKPHESQDICGGMCAPTCQNPHPKRFMCPGIVCIWNVTSSCRCDEGYLRDANTQDCLLPAECPTEIM